MNPTASPLDESDRAKIIASLNIRLADASDLYNGAKQAHWNVRVPNFRELHALFSDVAEMLAEHADSIAERGANLFASAIDGQCSSVTLGIAPNKHFVASTQLTATVTSDVNVSALTALVVTFEVAYQVIA